MSTHVSDETAIAAQDAHEALTLLRASREMLTRTAKALPRRTGMYDLRRALMGLAGSLQPMDEVLRRQWIGWRDSATEAVRRLGVVKR